MRRGWMGFGLAGLVLAAPLLAQGPAMGAMRPGAPGQGRMVDWILEHRQELQLTDAQVQRLEQIKQDLAQRNAPLLAQLRQLGWGDSARMRPPRGDSAARDSLRARRMQLREQARPIVEQLRENARAAMEQVRQVLTEEQRQKLRSLWAQERPGRQGMLRRRPLGRGAPVR